MIYELIINEVRDGAKFTVNFQKRTCRVNGKIIVNDMQYNGWLGTFPSTEEEIMSKIEQLYQEYKHSVPSERSESHRHYYFRALPEKELSIDGKLCVWAEESAFRKAVNMACKESK